MDYVIAKAKAAQTQQREVKTHSKPMQVSLSSKLSRTPKVDFPLEGFRK